MTHLNIVVDDLRSFYPGLEAKLWVKYCRSSQEAIDLLTSVHYAGDEINKLILDYDLGGEDDINPVVALLTGWGVSGDALSVDRIYVITANPVGRKRMLDALSPYYKVVPVWPTDLGLVVGG